jgi:hypothetical protein
MEVHSTAVLAYMAGLVDGEGTICIFPYYGKQARYPLGYRRYRPVISVTNTNRLMIEWIVEHFGGVVRTVKRYRQCNKRVYRWECAHTKAVEALVAIRPFLLVKKEQADLFIEFQAGARHYGRGLIPQDIAERREVIAAQIKELNRTGDPHAVEGQGRNPIH